MAESCCAATALPLVQRDPAALPGKGPLTAAPAGGSWETLLAPSLHEALKLPGVACTRATSPTRSKRFSISAMSVCQDASHVAHDVRDDESGSELVEGRRRYAETCEDMWRYVKICGDH